VDDVVVLVADLRVVFNPPRTTSSAASVATHRFRTRTVLAMTPEPLDPVEITEVNLLDRNPSSALAYWVGLTPHGRRNNPTVREGASGRPGRRHTSPRAWGIHMATDDWVNR
jgi:hypothetical protein